jgi:hypothetical protein
MNKEVKNYIVSSANWEFEVDDINPSSAVLSGVLIAFRKFGDRLLLSTTIMVNSKQDFLNQEIINASFFPTHKILKQIGLNQISKGFLKFTNEITSTR